MNNIIQNNKIEKALWITDPHLNFLSKQNMDKLHDSIQNSKLCLGTSRIFLTGDIAEGHNIELFMEFMSIFDIPVYFVLGNHDYYGATFKQVETKMNNLCKEKTNLFYLSSLDKAIQLTHNTCVVGVDGWYDGQYSSFTTSKLELHDFETIVDFSYLTKTQLRSKFLDLAKESASKLRKQLENAVENNYQEIVVLTHIPPFRENSVYRGVISDHNWLPYFSCKETGNVLVEFAKNNPGKNFKVFCGHSHGHAVVQHLQNLSCRTGEAEYRIPNITGIIEL